MPSGEPDRDGGDRPLDSRRGPRRHPHERNSSWARTTPRSADETPLRVYSADPSTFRSAQANRHQVRTSEIWRPHTHSATPGPAPPSTTGAGSLVSVAIAATLGTHEPLRGQLRIALRAGVTPDEIVDLFVHLEAYAGAARAFDIYQVALAVFAEQARPS
jgi:hypothetical protein